MMNAYPDNQAQQRPNVAVILPIYNQEKYVARALDSLLAQTYGNWIAYCVNDGSTDSTAEILRAYSHRDSRFVIITQPNGGVSSARNAGLEVALADIKNCYIGFLDPDDFMHPQLIEIVLHFAKQNPNSLIGWDFSSASLDAFCNTSYTLTTIRSDNHPLSHNIWDKIYPCELLRRVRFSTVGDIAEDLAFNFELKILKSPPALHIPVTLTYYSIVGDSATHGHMSTRQFRGLRDIIEYMIEICRKDQNALDHFSRTKLPDLLKQFYRYLIRRSKPFEAVASWSIFKEELRSLRKRGLLHPRKGRLKDIKYYLRFLIMSLR